MSDNYYLSDEEDHDVVVAGFLSSQALSWRQCLANKLKTDKRLTKQANGVTRGLQERS
jgi:hypothetical protein